MVLGRKAAHCLRWVEEDRHSGKGGLMAFHLYSLLGLANSNRDMLSLQFEQEAQ